jgi:hypothetical protein
MTSGTHGPVSVPSADHGARVGATRRIRRSAALAAIFLAGPPAADAGTIVTGLGAGTVAQVGVFDGATAQRLYSFLAYDPAFAGGVRVATGDVNGDGTPDIVTGSGPGTAAHVKVFDGRTGALIRSFFAFDVSFTGGVYVAAGDINGDGQADIVVGADSGATPYVRVFDGATGAEIRSFFAYGVSFSGGVRVATGDVNGDGAVDIVTGTGPGPTAASHVKAFDGSTGAEIRSFSAFDPSFAGGVFVAAGVVNGDGDADIVVGADSGAVPHVKVFDGATTAEIRSFLAYDVTVSGGVRVAAGDVNGDGVADIVTGAGPGGGPHVKAFDGVSGALVQSFFAAAPTFLGGVYVAAAGDFRPADTTPPVLSLPPDLTVPATSPAGATVFFTATATDAVDGPVPVLCQPSSGTVFPIGTTTVTCAATDSHSNTATGTFTVTVLSPAQMLSTLIATAAGLNFQQGVNLLKSALNNFNQGNTDDACDQLTAFINKVHAQSGKSLSAVEANQLLLAAADVQRALGCP